MHFWTSTICLTNLNGIPVLQKYVSANLHSIFNSTKVWHMLKFQLPGHDGHITKICSSCLVEYMFFSVNYINVFFSLKYRKHNPYWKMERYGIVRQPHFHLLRSLRHTETNCCINGVLSHWGNIGRMNWSPIPKQIREKGVICLQNVMLPNRSWHIQWS